MGGKKKLTKKERARMEAEQAELQRIEMEREKTRKVEEEKERKERERAEAEKRQKQEISENRFRRIQLKDSSEFFQKFQHRIHEIYSEQQLQKEWEHYMRCNGLPNATDPSDLRRYIHIWLNGIDECNKKERNWLLGIHEQSILTQDQKIQNLTEKYIRTERGNLGDAYSRQIREVLGILREMQEAIECLEIDKKSIIMDLHQLKIEYRNILDSHIDEYSFKVLCNINRDMELQSPTVSVHFYCSDIFKSQLYTVRDIPQPPLNPKEKLKEETCPSDINFASLGINLTLPPIVKIKNSALRTIWLNYDNYSDYCPSFYLPKFKRPSRDLRITTKKEWVKRWEILQTTLEEPDEQPEPEENELDRYDEMESEMPKTRIIDVDKIYLEYEDEINKLERKKKGPEALRLTEFEVNLRKYRIVGGIYGIDYLEQPQQDNQIKHKTYLRTLAYPHKLTRKPFYQAFIPPPPPEPGVRRLPEEIEAEMKYMEKNLEKLSSVTIQLTDDVFWFEPPVVCRWETLEETEISIVETAKFAEEAYRELLLAREENKQMTDDAHEPEEHDDITLDRDIDNASNLRRLTNTPKGAQYHRPIKEVHDFNLLDIPPKIDMYTLMNDFVVPKLPDGYGIKIDNVGRERKGSILKYKKDDEQPNDLLNTPPTKRSDTIDNFLYETNSPRTYYPRSKSRYKLRIIQREQLDIDPQIPVYMFSKFMSDLNELLKLQKPKFKKKFREIERILSPDKKSEEDVKSERHSAMSLIKGDVTPNTEMSDPTPIDDEIMDDDPSDYDEEEVDNEAINAIRNKIQPIGKWTTRDVHDQKFNEDKLTIQFRSGRLGYFGLASNRYSNLPYQTWELKPDFKTPGTVIFGLTASVINIEIQISSQGVQLNSMQGGSLTPLQSCIGVVMPLANLIKIMQQKSIDLFPDDDAFSYMEGSCEKNNAMEFHLYSCMGALALSHNFSWSRWNLLSGSRTAVILMRELLDSKKLPPQTTLYVTPLKAIVVECTEVSTSFNTTGVAGMDYYADLYHLAQAHSHKISKEKQESMCPILRDNVIKMLQATRPISFC